MSILTAEKKTLSYYSIKQVVIFLNMSDIHRQDIGVCVSGWVKFPDSFFFLRKGLDSPSHPVIATVGPKKTGHKCPFLAPASNFFFLTDGSFAHFVLEIQKSGRGEREKNHKFKPNLDQTKDIFFSLFHKKICLENTVDSGVMFTFFFKKREL